jgi:hypothetical protein
MTKAGLRRFLELTRQRMLSFLQIGPWFLMACTTHDWPLLRNLSRPYRGT